MRGGKSLPPEQLAATRAFVRALVANDFNGNVSAFSRAVRVSQSQVAALLNEAGGAGPKLLEAVATYAHVPIDAVIGRGGTVVGQLPLSRHPDWLAARAAAEGAHPEIGPAVWELAGAVHLPLGAPDRLDASFVAGLARELDALTRRAALRSAPKRPG